MNVQKIHKDPIVDRDWDAYYNATSGRPPRETLLTALSLFQRENTVDRELFAIDLGCGEGRDTVELLRQKWRVLAVDSEPKAIERLLNRSDIDRALLTTTIATFEAVQFPPQVDLINASFSLPFCKADIFPDLWQKILTALPSGGRFSGQLFGDRDSWAIYRDYTFHDRSQVEELLNPFAIEMLKEEEEIGQTPLGESRNWHIFHIVARKI
jgi:tellurite methyltransferase